MCYTARMDNPWPRRIFWLLVCVAVWVAAAVLLSHLAPR